MREIKQKLLLIKIYLITGATLYHLFQIGGILLLLISPAIMLQPLSEQQKTTFLIFVALITLILTIRPLYHFIKMITRPLFIEKYLEQNDPSLKALLTTVSEDQNQKIEGASEAFLNHLKKDAADKLRGISPLTIPHLYRFQKLLPILFILSIMVVTIHFFFNHQFTLFIHGAPPQIEQSRIIPIFNFSATITPPAYLKHPPLSRPNFDGLLNIYSGSLVKLSGVIDEPFESCALEYGGKEYPCTLTRDRFKISNRFFGGSFYRIVFYRNQEKKVAHYSTEFPLTLRPDLPPEAAIVFPKKNLELRQRDVVEIRGEVSDDIAISKVLLIIQANEEKAIEEKIAGISGKKGRMTYELPLKQFEKGDTIRYHLQVQDNDTILGPKISVSNTYTINILSPMKIHDEILKNLEIISGKLTGQLANYLEIDLKQSRRVIVTQKGQYNRKIMKLVQHLFQVCQQDDPLLAVGSRVTLKELSRDLYKVIQEDDIIQLPVTRKVITTLENTLIFLVDILDREKLEIIQELYRDLREKKEDLKKLIMQYQKQPNEQLKQKILSDMKRIQKRIATIMERLNTLSRDIDNQFLNREAAKTRKMAQQAQSMEELLQKGDIKQLLEQLDMMEQSLDQLMDAVSQKKEGIMGDRETIDQRSVDQYRNELQDIIHEQKQLYDNTAKLSKKSNKKLRQKLSQKKQLIKKQIQQLQQAYNEAFNQNSRFLGEYDLALLEQIKENLLLTISTLKEFDLPMGIEILKDIVYTTLSLGQVYRQHIRLKSTHVRLMMKQNQKLNQSVYKRSEKVLKTLQKLFKEAKGAPSPQNQKKMEALAKKQQQLRQKLSKLEQLRQKMPQGMKGGGEKQGEIDHQMEKAAESLGKGAPKPAQLQEEQALKQLQQMKQKMDQQMKTQSQQTGNKRSRRVEIPDPKNKGIGVLRHDLLKAMKRHAPEGYQDVVKSYFKNLINQ